MCNQDLRFFQIRPDYDLNLMNLVLNNLVFIVDLKLGHCLFMIFFGIFSTIQPMRRILATGLDDKPIIRVLA
jgi:hypothetical protein